MTYEYGMRLRGFSPGCQPKDGFSERRDDPDGKYYDILVYDRELTDKEVTDYELDRLKSYHDRAEYLAKYHAKNIKQYKVSLNRNTDADMMAYLDALPNVQGYIKGLIAADMARRA